MDIINFSMVKKTPLTHAKCHLESFQVDKGGAVLDWRWRHGQTPLTRRTLHLCRVCVLHFILTWGSCFFYFLSNNTFIFKWATLQLDQFWVLCLVFISVTFSTLKSSHTLILIINFEKIRGLLLVNVFFFSFFQIIYLKSIDCVRN